MPIPRLDPAEIEQALAGLSGWTLVPGGTAITCSFVFKDFAQAFAFMVRVAEAAEQADHHPDWSNNWNRVDITLTTHAARGLTARDLALARAIAALG